MGRTERILSERIKEHLPRWTFRDDSEIKCSNAKISSSILRHVVHCQQFNRSADPADYFTILANSNSVFILRILEALFILELKPPLCIQKDLVYTTKLIW